MERFQPEPVNKINREANKAIAHGVRVQGTYYDHGRPQTHEGVAAERAQLANVREQLSQLAEHKGR